MAATGKYTGIINALILTTPLKLASIYVTRIKPTDMEKSNAVFDKLLDCDMFHDAGPQGDEGFEKSAHKSLPISVSSEIGPQGEDAQIVQEIPSTVDESISEPLDEPTPTRTRRRGPGVMALIGYFILRVTFILAGLALLCVGGLYAMKFCGIYDPCEQFYVASSDCAFTPYMNGLFYYVECTEEHHCILPGFVSTSATKDWKTTLPATPSTHLKPAAAVQPTVSTSGSDSKPE